MLAPWYRWARQIDDEHVARSPRETRPVFQKFDRPDFVDGFLKDPQHSLTFDDVDRVRPLLDPPVPAPPIASGILAGKRKSFYSVGGVDEKAGFGPLGIRKLFLDTHRRHYLVVCELHCDEPGLPNTSPSEVCQAGFVIRRRVVDYGTADRKEAYGKLKKIVELHKKKAALETIAELEKELEIWRAEKRIVSRSEGWIKGDTDRVGSWQVVQDTPDTITEDWFPLRPVFADPRTPSHAATGRGLYFGVVPTSSLDTTQNGTARFDSDSVYEVRCFVRRHKPECPRTQKVPDCRGTLYWSRPTESYRLAAQFDLVGTANHAITIQMPDLGELAAQALTLPLGKFSPVKVIQPQSLNSTNDGKGLTGGSLGGKAVCFFAIPLITIVAMFLLTLFLPIVVLVFGLWFLLAFKFCIPPSVAIDATLQVQLDALASAGADIDLEASFSTPHDALALQQALVAEVASSMASATGSAPGKVKPGLVPFASSALLSLHNVFKGDNALPHDPNDPAVDAQVGPDLSVNYEQPVTAPMVVS